LSREYISGRFGNQQVSLGRKTTAELKGETAVCLLSRKEVVTMPLSPEKWIDLLTLYGPMALFVFMVFVLLRLARPAGGLPPGQRKVQVFAYVLVWLSIFVLAGMIATAWWRVNFPKEFVVRGTITNLSDPEMITTNEDLYLHKRPTAGLDFEYQWRLIKPQLFTGNIELVMQKKPTDVDVLKYILPIRNEFYKGTVDIEYDQTSNKMTLIHGTEKREEIAPSATSIPGEGPTSDAHTQAPFTSDIVYAAVPPQVKPEDLIRALDADDPLIRANARRDLIALGSPAIPYIGAALTDPASSYRLKIEALSTLKDMNQSAKQALSPPARCAIARAANDADPRLRGEANAVVSAGVTIPATCGIPVSPAPPVSTHDLLRDTQPEGLAFLPSGMVILDARQNRERLLQARASGLAVVPTGVFQYPHDIAAAEIDGRQFIFLIWTSPTTGSWLTVYSTDGATWNSWSPSVRGEFSTVVTDPSTHTIYLGIRTAVDVELLQLRAESVLSRQPHPFLPFSITGSVGGNQSPSGPAAVDSANARLFLATTTGGILIVDLKTPGSRPTPLTLPGGLGIPEALAFDSVGHTLYVGAGHHLWAVDVGNSSTHVSEFPPHHRFGRVTALGLDSDHRLWVGDWDARALYLISVSGQMIQTLH
jgi:hypothetical protein